MKKTIAFILSALMVFSMTACGGTAETTAPAATEKQTEASTAKAPETTEAPSTAEPTTEAPATEAPTTAEPTTEAPSTAEPATEAPTTAEPTTEVPSTAEEVKLVDKTVANAFHFMAPEDWKEKDGSYQAYNGGIKMFFYSFTRKNSAKWSKVADDKFTDELVSYLKDRKMFEELRRDELIKTDTGLDCRFVTFKYMNNCFPDLGVLAVYDWDTTKCFAILFQFEVVNSSDVRDCLVLINKTIERIGSTPTAAEPTTEAPTKETPTKEAATTAAAAEMVERTVANAFRFMVPAEWDRQENGSYIAQNGSVAIYFYGMPLSDSSFTKGIKVKDKDFSKQLVSYLNKSSTDGVTYKIYNSELADQAYKTKKGLDYRFLMLQWSDNSGNRGGSLISAFDYTDDEVFVIWFDYGIIGGVMAQECMSIINKTIERIK